MVAVVAYRPHYGRAAANLVGCACQPCPVARMHVVGVETVRTGYVAKMCGCVAFAFAERSGDHCTVGGVDKPFGVHTRPGRRCHHRRSPYRITLRALFSDLANRIGTPMMATAHTVQLITGPPFRIMCVYSFCFGNGRLGLPCCRRCIAAPDRLCASTCFLACTRAPWGNVSLMRSYSGPSPHSP